MRVAGIVGWKNSGKTTLVERLVTELTGRGVAVSTIKHAHHEAEVDRAGTDSWRHREAGARETLLATPVRWALMRELRGEPEPALEELLAKMSPVDLVLVEGFKRDPIPKIECWRAAVERPPRAMEDRHIVALASDGTHPPLDLPVLPLDDVAAVADFALRLAGIGAR